MAFFALIGALMFGIFFAPAIEELGIAWRKRDWADIIAVLLTIMVIGLMMIWCLILFIANY